MAWEEAFNRAIQDAREVLQEGSMTSKTDTNPCGVCRTGYGTTHMCGVLAEQNAELLAALEAYILPSGHMVGCGLGECVDICRKAREAIAKARGEA